MGRAHPLAQRVPQPACRRVAEKNLTFDETVRVQGEAESLLTGHEHEVDSRRVLELVRDSNCSAYDCEFVVLVARLATKVVTMDANLLKAFPQHTTALTAR